MRGRVQRGFTLVELLVVMVLLGVVLTALTSTFISGSRTTTLAITRAELQQEVVNAEQLIASRVKEAYYVFPPGQTLALGGGDLRRNPVVSPASGNWTIGTHPILAMILPPKTPGADCKPSTPAIPASGSTPATPATDAINTGCYRFYAYYPVKRSVWVGGTSGASNPGPDANNDASTWVFVEYRDYYYESSPVGSTPTPPPTDGSDANLLSDYIMPTNTTGATYTMFSYQPSTAATTGVTGVNISLATGRTVNGKLTRLPGATGTYDLSAYPLNLGDVAVP